MARKPQEKTNNNKSKGNPLKRVKKEPLKKTPQKLIKANNKSKIVKNVLKTVNKISPKKLAQKLLINKTLQLSNKSSKMLLPMTNGKSTVKKVKGQPMLRAQKMSPTVKLKSHNILGKQGLKSNSKQNNKSKSPSLKSGSHKISKDLLKNKAVTINKKTQSIPVKNSKEQINHLQNSTEKLIKQRTKNLEKSVDKIKIKQELTVLVKKANVQMNKIQNIKEELKSPKEGLKKKDASPKSFVKSPVKMKTKKEVKKVKEQANGSVNLNENAKPNLSAGVTLDVEKTILAMQDKIFMLEQKSMADEKKLNNLKTSLIKQRNEEIKTLMEEKEKELLSKLDLLYVDYEPKKVCRLCLLFVDKEDSLASLVDDPTLAELLKSTIDLQIENDDSYSPKGICGDCLQKIKEFDWMKRRCHKANMLGKKFMDIKKKLEDKDNTFQPIQENHCTKEGTSGVKLREKQRPKEDVLENSPIFNGLHIKKSFSLNNAVHQDKKRPRLDEGNQLPTPVQEQETKISQQKVKTRVFKVNKCRSCETVFINRWSYRTHIQHCNGGFTCNECGKCFYDSKLYCLHKLRRRSCKSVIEFRFCEHCNATFRWKWQLLFHIVKHNQLNKWEELLF